MSVQNKLFTTSTFVSNALTARQRINREYMISSAIAEELNTYKNAGIFPTYNDVGSSTWDATTKESTDYTVGTPGVRSIFNKYSAVLTGADDTPGMSDSSVSGQAADMKKLVHNPQQFRLHNNVPLLDSPDVRKTLRAMSGCSVKELVANSHKGYYGRATYDYSDFMYCKYLGKVPNNQLITLRRYPAPVLDTAMPYGKGSSRRSKAGKDTFFAPIGTMVTWMGVSGNEMQNILKYDYSMAFEEKQAKWDSVSEMGGGGGKLGALEAALNSSTRNMYSSGTKVPALDEFMTKYFKTGGGTYQYNDGSRVDANKVYGPIDRVKKNYMRSEAGLDWNMKFDLVFEYELRAYNGINPRQAMLDLISHILSVTYVTGGFWGGGYRGGGMKQSSTFSNLKIFQAQGGFTNFMSALSEDFQTGASYLKNTFASYGGILETIKAMANAVGGMLIGGFLNQLGRPKKYFANSLISEAPVGLWHITFGNPNHPIMSMGNMILKSTKIEHSGPLGLDDFPSNLKVTCSFDRGKPRDQVGVEALYMHGNDRIAHSMSKKLLDMYERSAIYKGQTDVSSITSAKSEINEDGEVVADTGSINVTEIEDFKSTSSYLDYCFGQYEAQAVIVPAREQAEGAFKLSAKEKAEGTE